MLRVLARWPGIPILVLLVAMPATAQEPIQPLPESVDVNEAQAALGEKLFKDKRFSSDNSTSCHTCHLMSKWGTDRKRVSTGAEGLKGRRNSPTVINAVFNFRQFWDGRAKDLKDQVFSPVTDNNEMGFASAREAIEKLRGIEEYRKAFQDVFGGRITQERVATAIAEYEKTLIAPNSPFDQYLRGNESAITEKQKRGYRLFKAYGCISCHQGKNVGGNMFQKFGAVKDIKLRQEGNLSDLGRYEITGDEWDKYVFKVPSLRLAAKTPPYFHDGSAKTLRDAVDVMFEFQVNREAPPEDKKAIIAFIRSLAGEHPEPDALKGNQ